MSFSYYVEKIVRICLNRKYYGDVLKLEKVGSAFVSFRELLLYFFEKKI